LNRTVLIGIAGAVIVLVALLLNDALNEAPVDDSGPAPAANGGDATASAPTEPAGAAPQPADTTTDALKTAEEVTNQLTGTPDAGDNASAADGDALATRPSFDVVRISRAGDTVIAGRAPPGSTVSIYDGDELIGTVTADARGEWVYLPDQPLAPGSHELSLRAVTGDGVKSEADATVVLVVPEAGKDIAGRPTTQPQEPLAMLVPKNKGEVGARVLQKPSVPGSVESDAGDLALDSVDYDEEGNVSLGGRGIPGTEVRAYLNNDLVGRAEVPPTGLWRVTPEGTVAPGAYELRLDMVRDGGEVAARVQLPFSRAEPMRDFKGGAFVVVQPGNSLWRIARRTLDSGYGYTVIYEANKDQIRDPDLIYPGQIFEVPAN